MKKFDVVVVGAGMLGIAHAWAAAKRGLSVAVIERSRRAHGATIRNFGQVIVTGQAPGMMLSHAQQARELWRTQPEDLPTQWALAEALALRPDWTPPDLTGVTIVPSRTATTTP